MQEKQTSTQKLLRVSGVLSFWILPNIEAIHILKTLSDNLLELSDIMRTEKYLSLAGNLCKWGSSPEQIPRREGTHLQRSEERGTQWNTKK